MKARASPGEVGEIAGVSRDIGDASRDIGRV
jgi:hypothetical protein